MGNSVLKVITLSPGNFHIYMRKKDALKKSMKAGFLFQKII